MTDDEHGIAGPPSALGLCDCGHVILEGESYNRREERRPVYGRIGDPGRGLTGFARGPITWTCGECIKARSAP